MKPGPPGPGGPPMANGGGGMPPVWDRNQLMKFRMEDEEGKSQKDKYGKLEAGSFTRKSKRRRRKAWASHGWSSLGCKHGV